MKKLFILTALTLLSIFPQSKRAITVDDLWNMKRVGSFDLSPDGKKIVFELTAYTMESNKGNKDIYVADVDGKNLLPLKNSEKNESSPKFIPGTGEVSFIKDGQIFKCDIKGQSEKQITNLYTQVNSYTWSPDGKSIMLTSSVIPECTTQECNKVKDDEAEASKVKASIFSHLMYRSWNEWRGNKRSHLFLYDIKADKYTDIISGKKNDVPPVDLGTESDFNFSPDGSEIAFTMNEEEYVATSTNNDIFTCSLKDNSINLKKVSVSPGNDAGPIYSPDGKYLAFLSMKRAGFEADKKDLILLDRTSGSLTDKTDNFKLSVSEYSWSPDSKYIYFVSENEVYSSIYKLDVASGSITMIIKEHLNSAPVISPDGKVVYFKQMRTNLPVEIFSMTSEGKDVKEITFSNKELLSQLEMNPIETFWSKGEDGTPVQSILVKPPFFDPNKKYPMIFLIHGGPQGHWDDDFHYRWNQQMFASKGYVVVSPNPRGSTGYGQKFTDEISGDWGGKPYTDLMNSYDYAIKNFNFIDKNNTFAAGASYGGYMINWLEGHETRFNAVVSHDGVFNLESMWGTTEEIWFPEWEFKGTPWQNRALYEKWSPHRYIQNAKTPMLVVHGALDFRVTEDQAFQLFSSLQRLGVESKFLYFPDEFHFVVKPQNAKLWWTTVFDWFENHKKTEKL